MAVINATIISMLVYIYNFIRFGASATVTYSVSFSLFAVVMFASIFGTLVPMTLEKLKIDPAIATVRSYPSPRHYRYDALYGHHRITILTRFTTDYID